jgi:hypothetical protein
MMLNVPQMMLNVPPPEQFLKESAELADADALPLHCVERAVELSLHLLHVALLLLPHRLWTME